MSTVLMLSRPVAPGSDEKIISEARAFGRTLPGVAPLQACVSLDGTQACIYAWADASLVNRRAPELASLSRLATLSEWNGVSSRERAPYHYVVATDVDPAKEIEFNTWYHTEHMPALSGVAGSVHCARFRCLESRPRYRAVYDLTAAEVMQSDAWLSIRNTSWAGRMRGHFVNTTRTMFRTVLDERASIALAA
jgi:hypothetical protein